MFQGRALFRIDKGRLLILPNEGRSVWLETRVGAALKVSARETGDSFSALELVHHSWFYCSSGHSLKRGRGYLRYRGRNRREDRRSSGHRAVRVLRFQARNVPHTFWNPGTRDARTLEMIAPPDFARCFEELSKILSEPGSSAKRKESELDEKYGLTNHSEWLP